MATPRKMNPNTSQQGASTSQHQRRTRRHLLLAWLALVSALVATDALASPQYQQHNNILHFNVYENAPNNTPIGIIRSADGQLPYLVLPAPQTPEFERVAALNINLLTGNLTTNAVLDREHREQYHFVAIVKEPFAEIKCTVTVIDVNDNAPIFLLPTSQQQQGAASNDSNYNNNYVIDMPEGQRGIRKVLPLAIDFDTPPNGIKEFRIVSGNTPSGTFQLVEHEAPARSSLQSNLISLDDPSSSMSASLLAGDNPQLMQQLAQQATVLIPSQPSMQSSISTNINTNNNLISSSSSPLPSAAPISSSKFLIDLEVNQTLDRENQSSYQLVVEAIDGGQTPLIGRLMVTVNVIDINDNDPIFTRKLYECHFREDTSKGTPLVRVQAHDADLDTNGQISYFIKRHSSSSQPTTNLLNSNSSDSVSSNEMSSLSTGVNRASSSYPTTSIASSNKRTVISPATAASSNINKQQLQATQQRSLGSNSELYDATGVTAGSDASPFKKVSNYAASPEQMFEIDSVKGEIYLAHQLDFETDQMHELLIEARDHGKPSRSAYAIVKVFVIDVNDDPPVLALNSRQSNDDRSKLTQAPSSEASRSESAARFGSDLSNSDASSQIEQNYFHNFNLINWFAQINSSSLFVIVLVALFIAAFPVCLVKMKSQQPESDYNDTAGLTLTSNNGQTKQSPSHSSNDHSNVSNHGDNHNRHLDYQHRSNGGSFGGLRGDNDFGPPNGKLRYQYADSNLYHNPYQPTSRHHTVHSSNHHLQLSPGDSLSNHQMAVNGEVVVGSGGGGGGGGGAGGGTGGGSGGGTMTLHNHHHDRRTLLGSPGGHHQAFPAAGQPPVHTPHHSSSLTYSHHHSRALLNQAHHHQSSHHLSSVRNHSSIIGSGHRHNSSHNNNINSVSNNNNNNNSKGGTMNSVGTHHSAHPPASPLPATPNTTHSSGLPPNLHDSSRGHHHITNPLTQLSALGVHGGSSSAVQTAQHHPAQLPPTPCNAPASVFAWPSSTMGACFSAIGAHHGTPGSTMDCVAPPLPTNTNQPLDRWFDLGVSSQLVYSYDWYGCYNWDYLADWTPDYHTLMPLLQTEARGY